MSDMEKFAYDIEQVRIALPQCAITITINPTVSFGEIKGTITAVPSLTGTASVTSSTKGFQYACPPIKPGQHNSNSTGIAAI